ncbi:metallophosphoesterase [Marinicella sediminis]|uniref:Metallophosphoesterase n=1 Tax=Marinicella sediminis TaxID=1792834 RepID=A0ABV7JCJ4_9GAMM|nr:metallophosphoesterase [Marinicella sediminis]
MKFRDLHGGASGHKGWLASGMLLFSSLLSAEVITSYVLYGQNTSGDATPMARVIVDGVDQSCPALLSAHGSPITTHARINPDPAHFPITVCEALYPFDQALQVANSQVTLPVVDKKIKTVAVFGDTGCKPSHQDCSAQSSNWPFPGLIKAAAGKDPDVVLHMGDYNYSGTPGTITINGVGPVSVYDAGDNTTQGMCRIPGARYGQNSAGSQQPDSWVHWQADFFSAAQPLFSLSPWIFARGNHELCSRAGPGWFYLLDPNSALLGQYQQQLNCPSADNPTPDVLSAPYVIDLSGLNVAVLDSANACDAGSLFVNSYENQLALMNQLIRNAGQDEATWVQTHRPLWGVDQLDDNGNCGSDPGKYCMINQTLQRAMNSQPLDATVRLIMSGHMHRFQVADFKSAKHPDQFVIGNSGVRLSGMHPKTTQKLIIDGHQATVMGLDQFGFMAFSLQKHNQWQGEVLDSQSNALLTCDSEHKPICTKPD